MRRVSQDDEPSFRVLGDSRDSSERDTDGPRRAEAPCSVELIASERRRFVNAVEQQESARGVGSPRHDGRVDGAPGLLDLASLEQQGHAAVDVALAEAEQSAGVHQQGKGGAVRVVTFVEQFLLGGGEPGGVVGTLQRDEAGGG